MSLSRQVLERSWPIVRRGLFALPAEPAHGLARAALRVPGIWSMLGPGPPGDPRLATSIAGVPLRSPIGLAPGFDKDCDLLAALTRLGFGFVAPGSIMRDRRPGNPKPRLARVVEEEAILNAMGLPSRGIEHAVEGLEQLAVPRVPLFIDVQGTTPDEIYDNVLRVQPFASAIEVSLVCPNTPDTDANEGLDAVAALSRRLMAAAHVPVFVKIPARYRAGSTEELEAFLDVCLADGVDGVVACGARHVRTDRLRVGHGQLGGRPVFEDTMRLTAAIHRYAGGRLAVIASGGIFGGADALRALREGASAVEIYSALIYRGPTAPVAIAAELVAAMADAGIASVAEIGRARPAIDPRPAPSPDGRS